jgi:hypothetical protein
MVSCATAPIVYRVQRHRDQCIALRPRKNYAYSAIAIGYDELETVVGIVFLGGFLTAHIPYRQLRISDEVYGIIDRRRGYNIRANSDPNTGTETFPL